MDFCAYFKKIVEDLKAISPPITVSQFLQARQHLKVCTTCKDLIERILRENPEAMNNPVFGEN